MAPRKKTNEIPLYDFAPGFEEGKQVLIYKNRKPKAKVDVGIYRLMGSSTGTKDDVLCRLYDEGLLIGAALDEAARICPQIIT